MSSSGPVLTALAALVLHAGARAQCEVHRFEDAEPGYATAAALDGDRAIVSTTQLASSLHFYERTGSAWTETAALVPSQSASGQGFGQAVALSGDCAMASAPFDDSAAADGGVVFVFEHGPAGWMETAILAPSDPAPDKQFGSALALDGDRLVVGAPHSLSSPSSPGAAYVFERTPAGWTETAKLVGGDTAGSDFFGDAVGLDGQRIVVGAWLHDHPQYNGGAAYVFELGPAGWTETQELASNDLTDFDDFGNAVAVDGQTIVVGAFHDSFLGAPQGGSAYVFRLGATGWVQNTKLKATPPEPWNRFGNSVAVSGDTVAVGSRVGRTAHVFQREPPGWRRIARFQGSSGMFFSQTISISGNELLLSDREDPSNGTDGNARLYALPTFATHFCHCDYAGDCGDRAGGCRNSTGQGAVLSACGSASVAADDLVLTVSLAPSGQAGILFMGDGTTQTSFGDGRLCVTSGGLGTFRYPTSIGSGTFVLGPGIVAFSHATFGAAGSIAAGQTWNFQGWFRDPAGQDCNGVFPPPQGFNLSNALGVLFAP